LKIVGQPGMGKAEFQELCAEAAREGHEAEAEKLKDKYETKFKRIEESLTKEERELAEDEAELSSRKMEELATHAENVLGIFSGSRSRRKVTTSITKRRMTAKAKADVEESRDAIEEFQEELVELERELVDELEEIDERWSEIAAEVEETTLTPYKKNIHLELFGVAWFPFWSMQEGDEQFELPGYGM
jgi:Skp family chaperone for outer membrane proteins